MNGAAADTLAPQTWMGAAGTGRVPVIVLRTLAALDAKLAECEAAATLSDDALRAAFATFRMDFRAARRRIRSAPPMEPGTRVLEFGAG